MLKKAFGAILLVWISANIFIFGPFMTIWAVNTLFGLHIPTNLQTWAAVLILKILYAAPFYAIRKSSKN